jgi:hypothetical protein
LLLAWFRMRRVLEHRPVMHGLWPGGEPESCRSWRRAEIAGLQEQVARLVERDAELEELRWFRGVAADVVRLVAGEVSSGAAGGGGDDGGGGTRDRGHGKDV